LTDIATEFKSEKNITADFSETEFWANGKIEILNLEVDCNDGFNGSLEILGETLKIQNSGFSRDYSENSEAPFSRGTI